MNTHACIHPRMSILTHVHVHTHNLKCTHVFWDFCRHHEKDLWPPNLRGTCGKKGDLHCSGQKSHWHEVPTKSQGVLLSSGCCPPQNTCRTLPLSSHKLPPLNIPPLGHSPPGPSPWPPPSEHNPPTYPTAHFTRTQSSAQFSDRHPRAVFCTAHWPSP